MRIYIFKSEPRPLLHAFAGDLAGTQLPTKYGPWHAVGVIKPEGVPPYMLPRKDIEDAIENQGFQLWRKKAKVKKASKEA